MPEATATIPSDGPRPTSLPATGAYICLVLGCGIHASRDLAPAQRSQLMKLRGDGNTDARRRRSLAVLGRAHCMRTSGAELERLRLRDAAEVWRVLEPAGAGPI